MQPLEDLRIAIQRRLYARAYPLDRQTAVGLRGGTEIRGTDFEQLLAIEREQSLRVLIGVNETARVAIEHDDGVRSMIDEQSVASLAFAHGLLGFAPLGDVPEAEDEHLAA